MAKELSIKGSFDSKELQKGLKEVNKSLEDIKETSTEAGKSLGEMLKEKNSTTNYKRQLMQLQKHIQDLMITYRSLSDEEKRSEFGVKLSTQIDELTAKAAMWRDTMGDAVAAINAGASDTTTWDAIGQGMNVLTSSIQTFAGVAGLSEGTVEALAKALTIMQTVTAANNAAMAIQNALQRESVLMQKILNVQIMLEAKARGLATKQTVAATIAQKALNAVAKANPYALLAAAVVAVGAAIYGLSSKAKKGVDALKDSQEAVKSFRKELAESGNTVAETMTKYEGLRREYQELSSLEEKNNWIEKNRSAMEGLGLAINDVTDADKMFITNSANVVRALELRAQAQAMETLYLKKYQEAYENMINNREQLIRENTAIQSKWISDWSKAGIEVKDVIQTTVTMNTSAGAINSTVFELTEEQKQKLKDYYYKQGQEYMATFVDGLSDIQKDLSSKRAELAEMGDDIFGNPKTKVDSGVEKVKETLKEMQKLVKDKAYYETQLSNLNVTQSLGITDETSKLQKMISVFEDWNETILKSVDNLNDLTDGQKKQIEANLSEIRSLKALVEERERLNELTNFHVSQRELSNITNSKKELQRPQTFDYRKDFDVEGMQVAEREYNKLSVEIDRMRDTYEKLQEKVSEGLPLSREDEAFIRIYDEKTEKLKQFETTYMNALSKVEEKNAKMAKKNAFMNMFKDVGDTVGAIDSIVDSLGGLGKTLRSIQENSDLSDAEKGWQSFVAVFDSVMNTINGVIGVFESINSIIRIANTLSAIFTGTVTAQTAAYATQAGTIGVLASAEGTRAATTIASNTALTASNKLLTGSFTGLAASEIFAAHAYIPFVGPIISAAMVAAMLASIGTAKIVGSFAEGGIVGGGSYIGDTQIARVNGGEMILNSSQQAKLFKLLDGTIGADNDVLQQRDVKLHIEGAQLVGVLNNYSRKRNRM